ncbi:MAG: peroxide stress protein YaaA [Bacteroidales bacterium]|nr:peroxide stress protein YaaA [Bacteroidales bacterium]
MIAIISPAKSLNFESNSPTDLGTSPLFLKEADYLAGKLGKLNSSKLGALLDISPKLAHLNAERYASWNTATLKQAIYAYDGDVYDGMEAKTFSSQEIDFAQKHLRIISGLYGLLQPLDLIKPYRIDMGTAFTTPKGENLYKYWGDKITDQLKKNIKESGSNVLINLASQEYFAVVNTQKLKARIITPSFKDRSNDKYAMISFFAKKARGMMSRFIIQNAITDPEMLVGFDSGGYNFNHELSKGDIWVFTRG